MTLDQIKAMDPVERFLWTAEERHRIYLRRKDGQPKPWTDDPIFQSFYFTNVYRELDKTTVWYREHIRQPLDGTPDVLMATIIFRWFNYIPTGQVLRKVPDCDCADWGMTSHLSTCASERGSLLVNWDPDRALGVLSKLRSEGKQIFTGAFMINSPAGEPKLEAIIRRIDNVWKERERLARDLPGYSMQGAHQLLTYFDGLGGFMAYEIVCDLRFTYMLDHAPDILTWANPGPGAIRGMYRVLGREIKNKSNATAPAKPKEWADMIRQLRNLLQERMFLVFGRDVPPIEAREVEMWLCEYDKYVRLLFNEGKAKRTYNGRA